MINYILQICYSICNSAPKALPPHPVLQMDKEMIELYGEAMLSLGHLRDNLTHIPICNTADKSGNTIDFYLSSTLQLWPSLGFQYHFSLSRILGA